MATLLIFEKLSFFLSFFRCIYKNGTEGSVYLAWMSKCLCADRVAGVERDCKSGSLGDIHLKELWDSLVILVDTLEKVSATQEDPKRAVGEWITA